MLRIQLVSDLHLEQSEHLEIPVLARYIVLC
jgi:hypothetical protein